MEELLSQRVQYSSSVWGVVLSTGWTIRDANVVCKQLGYPSGGLSQTELYSSIAYFL